MPSAAGGSWGPERGLAEQLCLLAGEARAQGPPQTCDPAGADVQCARQAQHVSQSDASRPHLGPLPRADGVPVKSALTQTDTWGCPSLAAVCFAHLPSCSQGSPPRCRGRASGQSPSDVTSRRGETMRRRKYCAGDYMAGERRARPQKQ